MSDHNLAEALRGYIEDYKSEDGMFDTKHYVRQFQEALAAHEAEQRTAAPELDRERAARREAQIELERYKSLLARSRIDLMRELREQGWRNPGEQQAGEAVAAACYIRPGKIERLQSGTDCVAAALARTACNLFTVPLYTRPQQPLSDEQIADIAESEFKAGRLTWCGFDKDSSDVFARPVVSQSVCALVRACMRNVTKDTK